MPKFSHEADAAADDTADDARAMTIPRCFLRKTAELKNDTVAPHGSVSQSSRLEGLLRII